MKKYIVKVMPKAQEDLQSIYDYVAYKKNSFKNAESQILRLQKAIEELDTMPSAFRRYQKEPWFSRNLHFFPVDNYLIFYIIDEEILTVNILRIVYGKMNLSKIWK